MSLHDKTHLAAHMEGAQLFTDLTKANQKVRELNAMIAGLKERNKQLVHWCDALNIPKDDT